MNAWLKEPLVHFLVLGVGLFLLYEWRGPPAPMPGGAGAPPALEVVVTRGDLRQMEEMFRKTWQRAPTEEERRGLLESFIRDEITYREALAAGLDREDSVIRRRLRMKMEFIFEDLAAQGEPGDQELQAFMDRNPAAYRTEPRIGFRQVYVNADRRGTRAEADARAILERLRAGGDPDTIGDATLVEGQVPPTPLDDIARQFGPGFAAALRDLDAGGWEGPLRSGFGWHLVRVEARREARVPELQEIREAVRRDWALARQQELKDAAYARLRERYRVVVEPPADGVSTAEAAAAPREVTR